MIARPSSDVRRLKEQLTGRAHVRVNNVFRWRELPGHPDHIFRRGLDLRADIGVVEEMRALQQCGHHRLDLPFAIDHELRHRVYDIGINGCCIAIDEELIQLCRNKFRDGLRALFEEDVDESLDLILAHQEFRIRRTIDRRKLHRQECLAASIMIARAEIGIEDAMRRWFIVVLCHAPTRQDLRGLLHVGFGILTDIPEIAAFSAASTTAITANACEISPPNEAWPESASASST